MELLSLNQAAERLDVKKSWIYRKVEDKDNTMPHIRMGKYLRFDWSEVESWILKNRTGDQRRYVA